MPDEVIVVASQFVKEEKENWEPIVEREPFQPVLFGYLWFWMSPSHII